MYLGWAEFRSHGVSVISAALLSHWLIRPVVLKVLFPQAGFGRDPSKNSKGVARSTGQKPMAPTCSLTAAAGANSIDV